MDLILAIIFCKLSLAFAKGEVHGMEKEATSFFFGKTWCLMPLSIKCWQLSLSCFPRERILFFHNNISQSSFTVGVSILQGHCHKRLKTCQVKYLSLKSIKLLSTTSGEISPRTNRIMNLLFSSFKGIRADFC